MFLAKENKLKDILFTLYRRIYTRFWWRYPLLFKRPRTPHVLNLELTNDCNQYCPHCPHRFMNRNVGYMQLKLFRKIVDEVESYPYCYIRIIGLGEPAMHPNIREIFDYLAFKHLKIEFVTNGTLLVRFSPEEILNWHIDILGISIDGYDATSYSRHRPGGDYEALRAKIVELYNKRMKFQVTYPKIQIRNTIFPSTTLKQIKIFTEDWLPLADLVTFNTLISKEQWTAPKVFKRCEDILFTIYIRWDGRVPLCGYQLWCGDVEWIGDLHDYDLRELWLSKRFLELRRSHAIEDYHGIEFCQRCFFIQCKEKILANSKEYNRYRNLVLSKIYQFA